MHRSSASQPQGSPGEEVVLDTECVRTVQGDPPQGLVEAAVHVVVALADAGRLLAVHAPHLAVAADAVDRSLASMAVDGQVEVLVGLQQVQSGHVAALIQEEPGSERVTFQQERHAIAGLGDSLAEQPGHGVRVVHRGGARDVLGDEAVPSERLAVHARADVDGAPAPVVRGADERRACDSAFGLGRWLDVDPQGLPLVVDRDAEAASGVRERDDVHDLVGVVVVRRVTFEIGLREAVREFGTLGRRDRLLAGGILVVAVGAAGRERGQETSGQNGSNRTTGANLHWSFPPIGDAWNCGSCSVKLNVQIIQYFYTIFNSCTVVFVQIILSAKICRYMVLAEEV